MESDKFEVETPSLHSVLYPLFVVILPPPTDFLWKRGVPKIEFLIVVESLECQGPIGPIIEELEETGGDETAVMELFEAFIDGEFIKTIPEEEAIEVEEEAAEEAATAEEAAIPPIN